MWNTIRKTLHKLLPVRVRLYLLSRDIELLERLVANNPTDIAWVDSEEELESELPCPPNRRYQS